MRTKLCTFVIALSSLLAHTAPAAAQQLKATGDWAAVQSLSPGAKIVVRLKEGNRMTGRFDSATDLVINFTDNSRKVSLTRDSIQRVQINRGKSRLKGAVVGAAIGGAGGTGFGAYAYYGVGDFTGATVPALGFFGAGVGAGIGAAIGKGNKNETVYESH